MRHLERPSTESAFPLRVRPSSLRETAQGQQSSSEASLCVSQTHLLTYSFTPRIPQFIKALPRPQQLRGHRVEFGCGRSLLCGDVWMLTGPSLVGQRRLMDMLEALSPQRCLCGTLTERQENNHVPPEAWHPALINHQTTGGHLSLQSYADR